MEDNFYVDDPDWNPSSAKKVTECIFYCSCSYNSGELSSPDSMESWQLLVSAAKVWKYQEILDVAKKIISDADFQSVKYHNTCRSLFLMKPTLELLQYVERNSHGLWRTSSNDCITNEEKERCLNRLTGDALTTADGKQGDKNVRPDLNLASSENLSSNSECIIHFSPSNDQGLLNSPITIDSWHLLLNAARILKFQPVLDIAENIKTDTDLHTIKYHRTCRQVFTRMWMLELLERNELRKTDSQHSSSQVKLRSVALADDLCEDVNLWLKSTTLSTIDNGLAEDDCNDRSVSFASYENMTRSNSGELGKCIIHYSCTNSSDKLLSPISMKSWNIIVLAARIGKYQEILDIVKNIRTEEDLVNVRYHNQCRSLFLMNSYLKKGASWEWQTTEPETVGCRKPKCLEEQLFGAESGSVGSDGKSSDSRSNVLQDMVSQVTLPDSVRANDVNVDDDSDSTTDEVHHSSNLISEFNPTSDKQTHPVIMSFNKHLESMAAMLFQYRADHFLCDALVMVDDGELQAHSVILSAVSPVFKAAFSMPNVSHCIRVSNVNMDVMKRALAAMYTGRIESEEANKADVIQLLLRLEVDDHNLLEREGYCKTDGITQMKTEEYLRMNDSDEPMIYFKSTSKLKSEADNIPEQPVNESMSPLQNANEGNNSKELIYNQPMRNTSNAANERCCNFTFHCSLLKLHEKRYVQETYKSLCYKKQCLMLASLIEVNKPMQSTSWNTSGLEKCVWTVKYFLPLGRTGRRIRVCQKTFCRVFSISRYKVVYIREKILSSETKRKSNQKSETREVDQSSPLDENKASYDPDFNDCQKQNDEMSLGQANITDLQALLSSECRCRQCSGIFCCNACGRNFFTHKSHERHILGQCSKASLFYKDQLDSMMTTVDADAAKRSNETLLYGTEGNYDCVYCSMTCATLNERIEHVSLFHGKSSEPREHVCDICNKRLSNLPSLKHHRRHACLKTLGSRNRRINLCPVCGKNFTTKNNLDRHITTHDTARRRRRFKCDLCSEVFRRQLMCIKHKEKVHGVIEPRVSVYCDKCGDRFGNVRTLRYHQRLFCRDRSRTCRDATGFNLTS